VVSNVGEHSSVTLSPMTFTHKMPKPVSSDLEPPSQKLNPSFHTSLHPFPMHLRTLLPDDTITNHQPQLSCPWHLITNTNYESSLRRPPINLWPYLATRKAPLSPTLPPRPTTRPITSRDSSQAWSRALILNPQLASRHQKHNSCSTNTVSKAYMAYHPF